MPFFAKIRNFGKGLALLFANFWQIIFQLKNALKSPNFKEYNIFRYFLSY